MNNSDDAVKDLAMWLEDMVLKRRLTHEEARDLAIKVRYWWKVAQEDERELLSKMRRIECGKE